MSNEIDQTNDETKDPTDPIGDLDDLPLPDWLMDETDGTDDIEDFEDTPITSFLEDTQENKPIRSTRMKSYIAIGLGFIFLVLLIMGLIFLLFFDSVSSSSSRYCKKANWTYSGNIVDYESGYFYIQDGDTVYQVSSNALQWKPCE